MPAAPLWASILQFRATDRDEQVASLHAQMQDMLNQIEQTIAGPVQIFKNDDAWRLLCHHLDQQPPRDKDAFAVDLACALLLDAEGNQHAVGQIVCVGWLVSAL